MGEKNSSKDIYAEFVKVFVKNFERDKEDFFESTKELRQIPPRRLTLRIR